jgi:hypothetical protein
MCPASKFLTFAQGSGNPGVLAMAVQTAAFWFHKQCDAAATFLARLSDTLPIRFPSSLVIGPVYDTTVDQPGKTIHEDRESCRRALGTKGA